VKNKAIANLVNPQNSKQSEFSEDLENLVWVTVGNGLIALRGRPKTTLIHGLGGTPCTCITTLLGEREGASRVGEQVTAANLEWVWIDLDNASPPRYSDIPVILLGIQKMCTVLENGGGIMIHCAAGFHRTGMITNALLRYLNFNKETAIQKIKESRPLTANEVGEHRLFFGDIFISICGTREHPTNSEEIEALVTEHGQNPTYIAPNKARGKKKAQRVLSGVFNRKHVLFGHGAALEMESYYVTFCNQETQHCTSLFNLLQHDKAMHKYTQIFILQTYKIFEAQRLPVQHLCQTR